jgi:hypothetical protein
MTRVPSNRSSVKRRAGQRGYAILLVLFLATLMLLATMAVAPNILTEGRREKETELVWRGKQYTRGIRMYYRKLGKFPTSIDDLTKPQLGNIRFMRQAYKDPMNKKDGSWRLIYVGPAGQLIGSLKPQRALQLSGVGGFQGMAAPTAPSMGGLAGQQAPGQFGGASGQPFGSGNAISGSQIGQFGGAAGATNPQQSQQNGFGANSFANATSADSALPAESDSDAVNEALINSSDPSPVMGGNVIGVGSKINQASFMVYDKAKNYRQFEFIWDPTQDPMLKGGNTGTIGTPAGSQPGQPGLLGQPGVGGPAGANPNANPNGPTGTQNNPVNPEPLPPDNPPQNPPPQY